MMKLFSKNTVVREKPEAKPWVSQNFDAMFVPMKPIEADVLRREVVGAHNRLIDLQGYNPHTRIEFTDKRYIEILSLHGLKTTRKGYEARGIYNGYPASLHISAAGLLKSALSRLHGQGPLMHASGFFEEGPDYPCLESDDTL